MRLGPGHTHILLSQQEAANIHKAEARGKGGRSKAESSLERTDGQTDSSGAAEGRREEARTYAAGLRTHRSLTPPAGLRSPSGGGETPLPACPAPPALGVAAAETATPRGAARARHGRPSKPPSSLPQPSEEPLLPPAQTQTWPLPEILSPGTPGSDCGNRPAGQAHPPPQPLQCRGRCAARRLIKALPPATRVPLAAAEGKEVT